MAYIGITVNPFKERLDELKDTIGPGESNGFPLVLVLPVVREGGGEGNK